MMSPPLLRVGGCVAKARLTGLHECACIRGPGHAGNHRCGYCGRKWPQEGAGARARREEKREPAEKPKIVLP